MVSSLAASLEEGAAAAACVAVSKNVDEGQGSTVARPERLHHMHKDVAELLLASSRRRRRRRTRRPRPALAAAEGCRRARYGCAFEDEGEWPAEGGGFAVPPRLVWAKVKSHPWWPGQVFDPADASELALRQRRRRGATTLVACFWDKTFVWADAAALRPFRDGFPRLAGLGSRRTSMSAFASAVDAALAEVARRVGAGLWCGCGCNAAEKHQQQQVIENAGVREGARGAAVDAGSTRDTFRAEVFVAYVSALAVAPLAGADRLDLTIATAQLRAFTRWRGAPRGLPEYTASYGIDNVAADGAMEAAAPASRATARRRKPRRGDGDNADASAGQRRMSRCTRGAATADAADTRDAFRAEASVEHISALAVAPLAGAGRLDLTVATPQLKAFTQWRGSPRDLPEHTASYGIDDIANGGAMPATPACHAKMGRSLGGDDGIADDDACAGRWRMTSCISAAREDEACENVGDDALEMQDLEPSPEPLSHHQVSVQPMSRMVSSDWGLGWKDYVIVMQFVVILVLLCELM